MNSSQYVLCAIGYLLAAVVGFAREATPEGRTTFHVAPKGNDSWSGRLMSPNRASSDGPFATIQRAQMAAREARKTGRATRVTLHGGTQYLDAPLVFAPEDSGTTGAPTIYEADLPTTLSGGVRIDGWQVLASGWWETTIPAVAEGKWYFEQLYVSGNRRPRTRLPEGNRCFRIARETTSTPRAAGKGSDRFGFNPGEIDQSWHNLQDVEILTFHTWSMSRLRIASVDSSESVVTLTGPTAGTADYARLKKDSRYAVENVREALRNPGEWYLDRGTGKLTYIPMPGETPSNTEVVAPRLDTLVRFEGDSDHGRSVDHIRLTGIRLAHTSWVTPPAGYHSVQAEYKLGAAVSGRNARNCEIEECTIAHTGTWAAAWLDGCENNAIRNCNLYDLGAGGVRLGEIEGSGRSGRLARRNRVLDSFMVGGGRLHPAAVGVLIGHSPFNVVEHNRIDDFYYTGISAGWTWGYRESAAHHNRIAHNRISRIGQNVISDMGGIYTLGVSPGTVLEHNFISDVSSHDYGGWGVYFDEGTSGVVARNNITFRTKSAGFHQHYGRENLLENNIFAYGRNEQVARSRAEEHRSFAFRRNVVIGATTGMLSGNWSGTGFDIHHNLYWNSEGTTVTFSGKSFPEWQALGHDRYSIIADPRFRDADAGDFRLRTRAIVDRIGFFPIDVDSIGPRRRTVLPQVASTFSTFAP